MLEFITTTLVLVRLLAFIPAVLGEIPLTQFAEYTQLPFQGRFCISSVPATYRVSFGCDLNTPAACLCTDPASSLQIATALRNCIGDQPTYYATISSVTQLWSSYCLTNAGVSAQDETILQDIPLFTQATNMVRYCASSATSSFITKFGCDAYTKAPCLCGTSASSMMVNNAVGSCVGTYDPDDMQTASMLWSSYCDVNLRQPVARTVGAPIAVSGKFILKSSQVQSADGIQLLQLQALRVGLPHRQQKLPEACLALPRPNLPHLNLPRPMDKAITRASRLARESLGMRSGQ